MHFLRLSKRTAACSILFLTSSSTRRLSHLSLPKGTHQPLPSVFYVHNHGFLKVSAGLIFSVFLGSMLAKLGAAALEENEIFVHYEDEEDD